MDIVRVKLVKPNTFWFLNDLHLGPDNVLSQPFDLDATDPVTRDKIEKAEKQFGIIKIIRQQSDTAPVIDVNKDSSAGIRYELPQITPMAIKIVDQKKEIAVMNTTAKEVEIPEISSITIEEEPEKEEIPLPPSETDYENARTLLARNGNTIKKIIRSIDEESLLRACIEIEMYNKDREGILNRLREALAELRDGKR